MSHVHSGLWIQTNSNFLLIIFVKIINNCVSNIPPFWMKLFRIGLVSFQSNAWKLGVTFSEYFVSLIRNARYRVPTSFFLRFIPFIFNSENTSSRLFQINITDTQIKFRQTFRLKLKALRDTYSSGTCYIIQLLPERLTSKCVQHILVLPTEMSLNIEKIVLENI